MDRLLDALATPGMLTIIDCLLAADMSLSALELRKAAGIAEKDRAHFGRQLGRLYDIGVVERDRSEAYSVAEADTVQRLIQAVANAQAALDQRRAERSAEDARERAASVTKRRTKRLADAERRGEAS